MARAITTILSAFFAFLAQSQNLEGDTILHLHFEKAGGIEQWKQLESYYIQKSSFFAPVFLPPHERSLDDHSLGYTKVYFQYPHHYRAEMYDSNGEPSITFLTNHKEAKMYMHSSANEQMLPKEYRQSVLFWNPLHSIGVTKYILSAYEKNSIEYNGKIEAYGRKCYMFSLSLDFPDIPSDTKFIVYLDAETHMPHATTNTRSPSKHKLYADYRSVNGFMIPYTNFSYDKDILFEEYKIIEAEINGDMDDLMFEIW